MAVEDRTLLFKRIKEWPNPSNRPELNIHIAEQCQANQQVDEILSQEVWHNETKVSPPILN
eukprot:12407862-Karenia_brevis.AAC.1